MTVIVSAKINDGVVMAADSAGSMASGQIYVHANKITNICEGLPVGAMSTGSGGIGNESIETLLKDLRHRFAGRSAAHPDWELDPDRYTVE
jgi:20S proteasome alpha/beta subunit